MKGKTFHTITSIIFGLIALLHLLRIFNSWPAQIGTFVVPGWLSWVALIVAGYLSYTSYKLMK